MAAKRGKKTRLTPAVQEELRQFVLSGAPLPLAAEAAGLPWKTVASWMHEGGKEGAREPYASFRLEMKRAKARWASSQVLLISKSTRKDWKAGAYLLERRLPDMFRLPNRTEISGPEQGPIETSSNVRYVIHTPQEEDERDADG